MDDGDLRRELAEAREREKELRAALLEMRYALAPFANFRVGESGATDGPDIVKTVAIVEKKRGVTTVIRSHVYDVAIPASIVYRARRALQAVHAIAEWDL